MGFLGELWNKQPNIILGAGLSIQVLLRFYIKLLNTNK